MGRKSTFETTVPWDSRWKEIPGFSNYYVSQYGQIFNMQLMRLMHLFISNKGIRCVRMSQGKRRATRSIAALVRRHFEQETDNG